MAVTGDPYPTGMKLGDREAFDVIYSAYAKTIYTTAMAILRGKEGAEDVLQQVFLQFWTRGIDVDPSKGSTIGYMNSVAKHEAIDALRRNDRWNRSKIS